MIMGSQLYQIQAKKIGLMMAMALRNSGISAQNLGQKTGFAQEELLAMENGSISPSLPQLQVIAGITGMPIHELINVEALSPVPANLDPEAVDKYCQLHNRIVAVQIKKNRLQSDLPIEQLSEQCGIPASDLSAYESGQMPVPLPVLLKLSEVLQLAYAAQKNDQASIAQSPEATSAPTMQSADEAKEENHTPSAIEESTVTAQKSEASPQTMIELPGFSDELKEFISKPINLPFLELAMKLSRMDAKKLREIAEGLLEITL
jgi:transcriptional regulator with XRE-family HTH domain